MLRDTQRYKFYLIETHKWEVEFFRSERDAGDFSRKRECRGTKDAGESRASMFQKKNNGTWSNIATVKKKINGAWSSCKEVQKKK